MNYEEFNDRIYEYLIANLLLTEEEIYSSYGPNKKKIVLKLNNPRYGYADIGEIYLDDKPSGSSSYYDEY